MNERRTLVIAAVAAIAVTLLYTFVLLRPKLAQIEATKTEHANAVAEESRLRAEIARLEAIRRDAPATIARLARISEALPSAPQLPAFIRATQAAATLAGVDLQSIAPSQPGALTGAQGIETITVTLVLEGAYVRIQDFLARMETAQRIVQISSISLSPKQDPLSSRTLLNTTLSLTMYVVQPNASLRGTAATTDPGADS